MHEWSKPGCHGLACYRSSPLNRTRSCLKGGKPLSHPLVFTFDWLGRFRITFTLRFTFSNQVLFANMIYLLTSIWCSVWGVGGVTLFLWNTHSVAPLSGRVAIWGVCSLCLHIIRGRKVPADQGCPFNPEAAVRSMLFSQDWWQLRSSCPMQIWLRVLSSSHSLCEYLLLEWLAL